MKITDLRLTETSGGRRASAQFIWEDNERPSLEIFFEVDEPYAGWLTANPHAFLAAAVVPAFHFGERRIAIDADICPTFLSGLQRVMRLLRGWYPRYASVEAFPLIECGLLAAGQKPVDPPHAAFYLSGGIDSLATLRANKLNFPPEHPDAFKTAVVVRGLQEEVDIYFTEMLASLAEIAAAADVGLLPIVTNARYLVDDWPFWAREFESAVFASVAHALSQGISSMTLGSSDYERDLFPHGSHPLLDPNYSSSNLRFIHDDVTLTRLEKTRLAAEWEPTLQRMRVCNFPEGGAGLNCGHCEKCLRTMLALVGMGKLGQTRAFPVDDVTADLVETAVHLDRDIVAYYPEIAQQLHQAGRHDLAAVIERKLRDFTLERQKARIRRVSRRPLTMFRKKVLHQQIR